MSTVNLMAEAMNGEGFAFNAWYIWVLGPHVVDCGDVFARITPFGPMRDWRERRR